MDYLSKLLDNLSESIGGNLSSAIAALIILILGWFIAGIVKRIVAKLIRKTGVDNKLGNSKLKLSSFISKLIYFLVMIFVFILALEKLGMSNVLEPVKNLLNGFTSFLPNIIGAGLVGYIGYMLATIVSELVELSGNSIKSFAPKLRLPENIDLVNILKKIVFIFIFIPLLISAFNILNMESISEPATAMLKDFFSAIPKIIVAACILILFIVGGRFLSELVKDLLNSMISKKEDNAFVASIIRMAILSIFLAIGLRTMGIADEIINLAFGITLGTVALTIILSFGLGGREAAGKQMDKILNKFNKK